MDLLRDLNRKLNDHLTPAVKTIFLVNVFIFLALNILESIKPGFIYLFLTFFAQRPALSFFYMPPFLWTFLTYAFVHVDPWHVLFNMLALWFFGPPIENLWGTRYFWKFYLGTAIGAGFLNAVASVIGTFAGIPALGDVGQSMIGASGAINAIFFAFACYYPEVPVLVFGIFPMKAKVVMALLIAFDIFFMRVPDGVSHTTHIAGLLIGYAMLVVRHHDPDVRTWRWRV
ncbi:MAG: rhomboid family intramembrane serine protease [Candidatus Sumerlaeia bacterium]